MSVATPLTTPAARYWFFGSDSAMAFEPDSGATYKLKFGPKDEKIVNINRRGLLLNILR